MGLKDLRSFESFKNQMLLPSGLSLENMVYPKMLFERSGQFVNQLRKYDSVDEVVEYEKEEISQHSEVIFKGFDFELKKVILLKEQLLLANFGAIDAEGEYDGLVSDFDNLEFEFDI